MHIMHNNYFYSNFLFVVSKVSPREMLCILLRL